MHKIKKKITKFIKVIMNEIKHIKNLFKKLLKGKNSILYSADEINITLLNKSRTSLFEKDKAFYKIYIRSEDQEIIYDDDIEKERNPFYTPFVEQKQDIDRSPTLYSINGPMQFFHAVVNIHFFSKAAIDPKYALLCVDLFSSKVYIYPMEKKNDLARKLELFLSRNRTKTRSKTRNETAN